MLASSNFKRRARRCCSTRRSSGRQRTAHTVVGTSIREKVEKSTVIALEGMHLLFYSVSRVLKFLRWSRGFLNKTEFACSINYEIGLKIGSNSASSWKIGKCINNHSSKPRFAFVTITYDKKVQRFEGCRSRFVRSFVRSPIIK